MSITADTTKFAAYLSYREGLGEWCVRAIDVTQSGVLHKVTYPDRPRVGEVFVASVAAAIRSELNRLNAKGEMMSNSDYILDLPGVQFRKLRVHVNYNAERGLEASFWFGSFSGQPLVALRQYAEAVEKMPQVTQVNNLAIHAIDRVIIPALNIVASVRSGVRSTQNFEVFEDYTGRLLKEADDLIMYAELVKRLIQSQKAHAQPEEVLEEAAREMPALVDKIG